MVLLIKNWQEYAYIVSQLYLTFLPHCTQAFSCRGLKLMLMLPYTPNAIWAWYFSKPLSTRKTSINPSQMQKSYHLKGALCPIFLLTSVRHLPSSACTHSHQLAPAARENLSTLGTERETVLQPTTLYHSANNPFPSVLHIQPLSPLFHVLSGHGRSSVNAKTMVTFLLSKNIPASKTLIRSRMLTLIHA